TPWRRSHAPAASRWPASSGSGSSRPTSTKRWWLSSHADADAEREIDDLYGLPLEDFTAARNALAARLKRDGEGEAAASVKALRKPSVPAAVLNQLARREPELVAALLDAGKQLRAAQQRALAGGRGADELRRATAAEREAVRELAGAARRLGGRKLTQ